MDKLYSTYNSIAKTTGSSFTSLSGTAKLLFVYVLVSVLVVAVAANDVRAQSNTTTANAAPVAYEVASGNLDKSVNNTTGNDNNGQRRDIPTFKATDSDGSIASYTIVTVPSKGILYNRTTQLTVGFKIPAQELDQLKYYAPEDGLYTFTYKATDNTGAVSNTAIYYLYVNVVPVTKVTNMEMELDPTAPGKQPIASLNAVPSRGAIKSFTIVTLPNENDGKIFVNGYPATVGQEITPEQATQLSFERASSFTGGTSSFTYNATDSDNKKASGPATYNLRFTPITPLPVTLVSFTARVQQQNVSLNWATANELNNDFFLIERSLNGKTFDVVSKVKGAGTSTVKINYTFQDTHTVTGISYYRLKQVDFDGNSEYSNIVAVQVKEARNNNTAKVYPNPATDIAKLDLTMLSAGVYSVRIVGTDGTAVQHLTFSNEVVKQLELNNLKSGHYIIQIQGQDTVQTIRLIKQ